jgi:thiol-disulfide isomerase/thioredoxin
MMKRAMVYLIAAVLLLAVGLAGCTQQAKLAAGESPAPKATTPPVENPKPGEVSTLLGKASPLAEAPPEQGKPPADITFTDAAGKQTKLSELKGKVVLLDFWASWCAPCKQELPHLVRLDKEYRDKGLVIIGIACQCQPQEVMPLVKSNNIEYQIYMDDDNRTAAAWEVPAFPSLVLIDKDGTVAAAMVGGRSYEALKSMVDDVLAGKPLPNRQLPS